MLQEKHEFIRYIEFSILVYTMEFYESISNNYDYIFPASQAQVNFISEHADQNTKVLDVGCATGSLALALAEKSIAVWAFDYDLEMIRIARSKKQKQGLSEFPVFEQLDMREIDSHYPANSFNQVVCIGNTLVHLHSEADILKFLKAAHAVLRENGKITIQILNYNYILSEKISSLPLIDNEHIRFERFYEFPSNQKMINFKTLLTEKANGTTVSNYIQLNPIRKNELEELLLKAGFRNISFYGSFKTEDLQKNSIPLIVVAEK